ncbi:hypothetical protein NLJ89_g6958 [Agrocybe chaxingu]|uniref:Uncharacterized protein n=1 Tax=Agrocybe chaxingu TaxID=84603 RepID=A0A9W8JY70_9AGAR|nr:hypothetical protein NLJ89_g6958 [Agrocybe chaxingu]
MRQRFEAQAHDWEAERRQLNREHQQFEDLKNSHAQTNKVNAELLELMQKWKGEKDGFQIEADEWKEKYRQLYAHWEGREAYLKQHHEAIDRAGCIVSDGQLKRKKSAPMGLYLQTDFSA